MINNAFERQSQKLRLQVKVMFYPKSPFLKNQIVESQLFSRNHSWIGELLEWLCKTPTITTYRVNTRISSREDVKWKFESAFLTKYGMEPHIYFVDEIPEVICISNVKNSTVTAVKDLKEVVVDTACGAAVLRGAHIFAPGVLSMESGTSHDETVNVFADLEGKCKKGTNKCFQSDLKVFLGTGKVKMQRYQLYGENVQQHGIAIEMSSTISGVPSIGDLSSSEALLQNFPSIVCVRVLDPQPGETILDMCSAPGNKTTHIVELMQDEGNVIAIDKIAKKIDLLQIKLKENSINSVKAFAFDSTKLFDESSPMQLDTPPFAACSFDRVLLDAPCSALGNRPLLSSNSTPKMLASYPKVQKRLFSNAVKLLKPGGVLVYSTCSITEEENEGIVKWALNQFPEMKLSEAAPMFGGPGIENCGLTDIQRQFVQRFGSIDYNRRNDIDSIGFFIAKFVKSEY